MEWLAKQFEDVHGSPRAIEKLAEAVAALRWSIEHEQHDPARAALMETFLAEADLMAEALGEALAGLIRNERVGDCMSENDLLSFRETLALLVPKRGEAELRRGLALGMLRLWRSFHRYGRERAEQDGVTTYQRLSLLLARAATHLARGCDASCPYVLSAFPALLVAFSLSFAAKEKMRHARPV